MCPNESRAPGPIQSNNNSAIGRISEIIGLLFFLLHLFHYYFGYFIDKIHEIEFKTMFFSSIISIIVHYSLLYVWWFYL